MESDESALGRFVSVQYQDSSSDDDADTGVRFRPNSSSTVSSGQAKREVELMHHNQRFQEALFKTVEEKLAEVQNRANEKELELKSVTKARFDLATALGSKDEEVRRLRKALERANSQLAATTEEKHLLETQCDHLKTEVKQHARNSKQLVESNTSLHAQLEQRVEELNQERGIRNVFKAEFAMKDSIEQSYKTQLEEVKLLQKSSQDKADQFREQVSRLDSEKHTLKALLTAQESETKRAQTIVEKSAQEIEKLEAANASVKQQWQDALRAMSERDAAIQQITAQAADVQKTILDVRLQNESLVNENEQLNAKLRNENTLSQDVVHLKNKLIQQQKKVYSEKTALSIAVQDKHSVLEKSEAKVDELTRRIGHLEDQNDALTQQASQAKGLAAELERKLGRAQEDTSTASRHLEKVTKELQQSHKQHAHLFEYESSQLKSELQQQQCQNQELLRNEDELRLEAERAKAALGDLTKLHDQLAHQNSQLKMELERRNYIVSKLEADMATIKATNVTKYKKRIEGLRGVVKDSEKVQKKVTGAFFGAQVARIRSEQKANELAKENERLISETRHAEQMSLYSNSKVTKAAEKQREQVRELDTVRLQTRKAQKKIADLAKAKKQLRARLEDSRYQSQDHQEEYKMSNHLLMTQLRTQKDKHQATALLTENLTRDKTALERRLHVVESQLSSQRRQTEDYARQLFQMKQKMVAATKEQENTQVQLEAWKSQLKLMFGKHRDQSMKQLVKGTARRAGQYHEHPTPHMGEQDGNVAAQPASGAGRKSGNEKDMRKAALHMQTVAAERLAELTRVKQELKALQYRHRKAHHNTDDLVQQHQELMEDHSALERDLNMLSTRCMRAECLAASFERQLAHASQDKEPNVDYTVSMNALSLMSSKLQDALEVPPSPSPTPEPPQPLVSPRPPSSQSGSTRHDSPLKQRRRTPTSNR